MVSFRANKKLEPRPAWSPFGVEFKISDAHHRLFYMGIPPGAWNRLLLRALGVIGVVTLKMVLETSGKDGGLVECLDG